MSIEFTCPQCNNEIKIAGLNYRKCPICGYDEKVEELASRRVVNESEVTLHEDTTDRKKSKGIKQIITDGLRKLGEEMSL